MTNIIQYDQIFTGLTPSEQQTAAEEWQLVGDALERKSKSLEDDMAIAASLERVKTKHSPNSNIYREYVRWLSDVDPTWQDKSSRQRKMQAYDGLKLVKSAGSEEQSRKSASLFESQAALAEARKVKDPHALASALQRRTKRVTAADMKVFNKTQKFPQVANSLPQQTKTDLTPSMTEDDKVLLLSLYINHRINEDQVISKLSRYQSLLNKEGERDY